MTALSAFQGRTPQAHVQNVEEMSQVLLGEELSEINSAAVIKANLSVRKGDCVRTIPVSILAEL